MSQTIKLKRSAVAGKVPTTSNLDLGEIALNTNDGKVFFKKDDGSPSIQTIVTTNAQITGSLELTGAVTASVFSGSFFGDGSGITGTTIFISGADETGTKVSGSVDSIFFDPSTGLQVTSVDGSLGVVGIGSHFKNFFVDGSSTLTATGSDDLDLIAGSGINLSTSLTDTNSNGVSKELIFAVDDTIATTGSNSFTGDQDITGALTASTAQIANLKYPTSDGAANTVIGTDGNGNLSFISPSAASAFPYEGNAEITGSLIVSASGATNDFQVGDNKLFVGSNGNVGIGTTSPESGMHILRDLNNSTALGELGTNGTDPEIKIENDNATAGSFSSLFLRSYTGDARIFASTTGVNNAVNFGIRLDNTADTSGITRFYIEGESGNVGIGTTSPLATLHLSTTTGGQIYIEDSNSGDATNITEFSNNGGNFSLQTRSNTGTFVSTDYQAVKNSNGTDYHRWFTNGSNERMRIDSSGNVGINDTEVANITSNYAPKLLVGGSIVARSKTANEALISIGGDATSAFIKAGKQDGSLTDRGIRFITGEDTRMTIDSSGNIGIGTTSPSEKLDVEGNIQVGDNHFIGNQTTFDNLLIQSSTEENIVISSADNIFMSTGGTGPGDIGTSRLFVSSSGNVGIGTTSPGNTLHVYKNATIGAITSTTTANAGLRIQDSGANMYMDGNSIVLDNTGYLTTNGAHDFVIGTNNTARIHVDSGGDVGIGTTSPTASLHVEGVGYFSGGSISFSDTVTSAALVIDEGKYIYTRDGDYLRQLIGKSSTDVIIIGQAGTSLVDEIRLLPGSAGFTSFYDGSSESMRITGGNVGIGTTVKKNGYDSGFRTLSVSGNGTDKAGIIELQGNRGANGNQVGMIQFWNTNTSDYETSRISGINSTTSVYDGQLQFSTRTSGSALTTRMIITEDGDVGIGTTSPGAKLDIEGELHLFDNGSTSQVQSQNNPLYLTSATDLRIHAQNTGGDIYLDANGFIKLREAGADVFTIDGGNVGIGTTSPSDLLHVNKNSDAIPAVLRLSNDVAGGDNGVVVSQIKSVINNGGTALELAKIQVENSAGSHDDGNLSFYTRDGVNNITSSERMRINGLGNVGIGTTVPATKLEVNGDIGIGRVAGGYTFREVVGGNERAGIKSSASNDLRFNVAAASEAMRIDVNGNVVIGNTSTTGKFNSYISAARQLTHNGNGGDLSIISDNNSTPVVYIKGTGTADLLNVFDNTTEVFTILDGGNVGISTTSPEHKLHIGPNSGAVKLALEWSDGNSATSGEAYSTIYTSGQGGAYPFSGRGNLILQPRNNDNDGFGDLVVMTGATAVPRFIVEASGNTIVKNDLTVEGKVTAEEFHTEFVSASIIYQSGSTKFGDTLDDVHAFTGSVDILTNTSGGNRSFIISEAKGPRLQRRGDSGGWAYEYGFNANDDTDLGGFGALGTGDSGFTYYYIGAAYNDTSMVVLDTGEVGIGTTSPDRQLQVHEGTSGTSTMKFTNSTTGEDGDTGFFVGINGSEQPILYGYNSTDMVFGTSGQERMRIDSSGNVGIGTTSPSSELEVAGIIKTIGGTANGKYSQIYVNDSYAYYTTNASIVYMNTELQVDTGRIGSYDEDLSLETSGTTRITVNNSSGNVGIGTTDPKAKLHIQDGGTVYNNGTNTAFQVGKANQNSAAMVITNEAGTAHTWFNFTDGSNYITADTTDTGGFTRFRRHNGLAYIDDVTIDSSGNVGIGTTSPAEKLTVAGNISGSGKIEINDGTRGARLGTDSSGTGNRSFLILDPDSADGIGVGGDYLFLAQDGQSRTVMQMPANSNFELNATTTNRLTISGSNGYVGIGTTSPSQKLHIVGGQVRLDSNTGGFYQYNTSGGFRSAFYDNGTVTSIYGDGDGNNPAITINSGNVGIGTTSPDHKLEIYQNADNKYAAKFVQDHATGWGVLIDVDATGNNDPALWVKNAATTAIWAGSGGRVGINTTVPSSTLDVNGTATVTSLVETSTRELKKDITELEDQSSVIDSLQPVTYTWKESEEEDFGLIAEDVEEIAPHLVHRDLNGKPTGIKYSKLSVLLLDVVQRQSTLIEDLNKRIIKLENERG